MKTKLLILTMVASVMSFAETRVGMVNVQKVITSIKMGKAVMQTLKKSYEAKKKSLKKEEDAIKKLQEDLKKKDLILSDKAKLKKQQEIRRKIGAIQQKTVVFQKEIQKQELELKKPILKKLNSIIEGVSKTEKVDMTFELTSTPILYAKVKVDLTNKVIKAFDKKYKK